MNFLKNLFSKPKEPAINSYEDFWNWFKQHEKSFHSIIKNKKHIEGQFFDKLSPKLNELGEGYFFLAGMQSENVAELIITADGNLKHMVYVEELVQAAPKIEGWKFTAHKPASEKGDFVIEMGPYKFSNETISFSPIENAEYPDEIGITMYHNAYTEEAKNAVINGCYIFLDNFIGEFKCVTSIDNLEFANTSSATGELVPIEKLKSYLTWREKEFVEKYEGLRHDTENDTYSGLTAQTAEGMPIVAIINTDLIDWDSKASHPWMMVIELQYDGAENNGMPDEKTMASLSSVEEEIMNDLKPKDGYLNIGRQTSENTRLIYFACKDFRKAAKVVDKVLKKYPALNPSYDIFKDKYWITLNRFRKKY